MHASVEFAGALRFNVANRVADEKKMPIQFSQIWVGARRFGRMRIKLASDERLLAFCPLY
ncbi:hypothetical protein ACFSHT_37830 [Paraburkholderia silviterrae]|uniref:Uncharacterized protein n=1 Tax=Paraburkholderia silviterrae TaxID=2528715 RepID=A0A4R5M3Z6_9BURK|nr:hypothetical protein [Paraburkholderia silviterrae]TDG20427.1 hypothetical protein EYW47_26665 [Paraburkholderia silviterrae]